MAGRGGTWAAIRIRGMQGKHPELKDKVIVPDVILKPHNASLGDHLLRRQAIPRRI